MERKVLVVPAQFSTLPPKLDSSLLLWVQGRELARSACSPAPHSQAGPYDLGHRVRPCCEKNNCLSLKMSSWTFLFTLLSGIQIDYVQCTTGIFFFLRSITLEFNLAVNCALVLA